MKFITLTRIPFGTISVNPDQIGAVIGADSDPGATLDTGCCVLVQGEEIRVRESMGKVFELLQDKKAKAKHGA